MTKRICARRRRPEKKIRFERRVATFDVHQEIPAAAA
jgi:hypothetical protein